MDTSNPNLSYRGMSRRPAWPDQVSSTIRGKHQIPEEDPYGRFKL
jgi:hypothetical protein